MQDSSVETQISLLPLVTVAIPTRDRARLLKRSLDSALGQTYENLQIIVSDNASKDSTAQVLCEYKDSRLVLLKHEVDVGMTGNWNSCVEAARGKYFLLLSDDDFLESTAIEKLVKAILSPATIAYALVR